MFSCLCRSDHSESDGMGHAWGAVKFCGVRKNFTRISPNFHKKLLGDFLCEYFLMKNGFGMTSKKRSSCDSAHIGRHFCPYFQGLCPDFRGFCEGFKGFTNFAQISADFAQIFRDFVRIFRDFVRIFRDFVRIFRDFAQIFRDFVQIFRDFVRIFTKSKLFGVRLHPQHHGLLHHCSTCCKLKMLISGCGRRMLFTRGEGKSGFLQWMAKGFFHGGGQTRQDLREMIGLLFYPAFVLGHFS